MSPSKISPSFADWLFTRWFRSGWRGVHAARRIWVSAGGAPALRARASTGAVFALNPYGYVDSFVLRDGFYESEVFHALQPYFGPGAILWDIGANFGLHAVSAKFASRETRVIAFEPNLPMAARLHDNAAQNGAELCVAPFALGAVSGWRNFYLAGGDPGQASLLPRPHATQPESSPVWCTRADELVASGFCPAPTVVKLDVEDGEADVLAGFGALLRRPELRAIVFEGAPGLDAAGASGPVAQPLREAGFKLRPLQRREATGHFLVNYAAERP